VKSNAGATGMPVYSMNDANFDAIFQDGTLTKEIRCFYVPIPFHQRFNNNSWFIEAGPIPGLIHKPKGIFETSKPG
jgi:hypothetical protein